MSEYYKDLSNTKYPDEIDEIQHVNDIGADTYGLANQYKTLVASGKIEEANTLLNEHPELSQCSINADKWNTMADSLMAVEQYAKSKKLPIVVSETEPQKNSLPIGGIWIKTYDEDSISGNINWIRNINVLTENGYEAFNKIKCESLNVGATTNHVGNGSYNSILSGKNNNIENASYSSILSGIDNTIWTKNQSDSEKNLICGGRYNFISGNNNSIVGGYTNRIGAYLDGDTWCPTDYKPDGCSIICGSYNKINTITNNVKDSCVAGNNLVSSYSNQFIIGQYNDNQSDSLFEVGNGSSNSNRTNAFSVTNDGTANVSNDLNVSGTIGTYGGINSYGAISSQSSISSQGKLISNTGAEINGNCELGVGYDFITYENTLSGSYRELKSIKYSTISIAIESNDWDINNTYHYGLEPSSLIVPTNATILGILPLSCTPISSWNFYMNYSYTNALSGDHKEILISTNNPQDYNIELTILYV